MSGEERHHQGRESHPNWQGILLGLLLGKNSREGRSRPCLFATSCGLGAIPLWVGVVTLVMGGSGGWFPLPFLALLLTCIGVCVC